VVEGEEMSGQIFISYRREESRWSARSLRDRLCRDFDPKQIFMDIDAIALGEDFVEAIETTVAKCDVLIAVIGNNWLTSKDGHGSRRLDNPEDFVRMEVGTALKRKIRVIPVLVDGALMPQSTDLPEDLKPLVRRNALLITDTSFEGDCQRLAAAIRQVLERTAAEERERLATEQRQREGAEARQCEAKERLEAERHQREEKHRRDEKERLGEPQTPPSPTGVIPAPEVKTLSAQTRDFAAQPWIRKIDKLSWLPFGIALLPILYLLVIQPPRGSDLQSSPFWLAMLVLLGLPSFVAISSFFKYPNRRILEVIASVLSVVLMVSALAQDPKRDFFIALFLETIVLALGAIMKVWLLKKAGN
jgi:hypothetical protein